MRDAMSRERVVGLDRVVLSSRERPILVAPMGAVRSDIDNNTTLNGLGRSDNVTIQNNYVNNWVGIGANFAYLANKLFPG